MDNLAKRLRDDADKIQASVSPELDYRIQASLQGIEPEKPAPARAEPEPKSTWSWLAPSLTGLSAAVLLVVAVNMHDEPAVQTVAQQQDMSALQLPDLPALPLKVEAAMTTSPLERELSNIRSDLIRARDQVTGDVEKLYEREDQDETP